MCVCLTFARGRAAVYRKKALSMPVQIRKMFFFNPAQFHLRVQSQCLHVCGWQPRSGQQVSTFVKADQEPVKKRIEVGYQQKAIENVQPLGVIGTFCPRFGVAGTQYLGQRDSCDGASTVPVGHLSTAIDVLADAFSPEAFDFGFLW